MAGQRRTKAEKQHARAQRIEQKQYSYSYSSGVSDDHTTSPTATKKVLSPKHEFTVGNLFSYDVELIYADLRKTVLLTTLIFALLIGIKFGVLHGISALKF